LQLSDAHLDPWYNASMGHACFCNVPASKEEQASCAATSTGNAFAQTGCDGTRRLLLSVLDAAVAQAPPGGYDWILITGDYTRHKMDRHRSANRQVAVRRIMQEVVEAVRAHFPQTKVHHGLGYEPFILGNNDFTADYNETVTDPRHGANPWFSYLDPTAAASVAAVSASAGKTPPLLAFADADWSPLDDEATFVFGGYGMRKLTDELYMISLNTVVYSTNFQWKKERQEDPFRQLRWFRKALEWLRKANREGGRQAKTLITGHIPPTVDHYKFKSLWRPYFQDAYLGIVGNYSDVVAAQIFAHMHTDTFRLFPAAGGSLPPPLFISSSISAIFGNNPSFRVWKYGGSDVLDYTVYGTEIRAGPQEALPFHKLYSAKEAYGLNAMSDAEWRTKVSEKMTIEDAVWMQYMHRLKQGQWNEELGSDARSREYRHKAICAVNNVRRADFEACLASEYA